ncbi:glycosyltransferase family 2 protein [Kitasatospora sp. CB02891]|uniref:glycosyltransferase n=1 Tax=Kitasatospora TaxID=2063 RepID=UPI001E4FB3FD|nr:glycosyltransferase family 2 protein [Kitasatospora sp. CB02891]
MTALWVLVPAYQEAARIGGALRALAGQRDLDFTLLVVDNGSTDDTCAQVRAFAEQAPFPVRLLVEPDKGVGCAVDTGFRHAIANGATLLARTDADCLPEPGWTAAARAGMLACGGLVCGKVTARRDEHGPLGRGTFRVLVGIGAFFGRIRPAHRRRHGYLTPYRMHAGNNMAVTAELYLASGGMPRRPSPTDRAFINRVRRISTAIVHRPDMVVQNSTRRIRAYGLRGTARWYLERGAGHRSVDVR